MLKTTANTVKFRKQAPLSRKYAPLQISDANIDDKSSLYLVITLEERYHFPDA